jgi:hypothetical protein
MDVCRLVVKKKNNNVSDAIPLTLLVYSEM